jgi:hypothetical protein
MTTEPDSGINSASPRDDIGFEIASGAGLGLHRGASEGANVLVRGFRVISPALLGDSNPLFRRERAITWTWAHVHGRRQSK